MTIICTKSRYPVNFSLSSSLRVIQWFANYPVVRSLSGGLRVFRWPVHYIWWSLRYQVGRWLSGGIRVIRWSAHYPVVCALSGCLRVIRWCVTGTLTHFERLCVLCAPRCWLLDKPPKNKSLCNLCFSLLLIKDRLIKQPATQERLISTTFKGSLLPSTDYVYYAKRSCVSTCMPIRFKA